MATGDTRAGSPRPYNRRNLHFEKMSFCVLALCRSGATGLRNCKSILNKISTGI